VKDRVIPSAAWGAENDRPLASEFPSPLECHSSGIIILVHFRETWKEKSTHAE